MLSVIIAAAVVLLDQISKYFVCHYLKEAGSITLIEGVLKFTYVENRGAAFGILSDNRAVFMVISVIIIALLGYVIARFHGQSRLFDACLGLILGGGIGNMIDRAALGYVVDFIDFCAFDFWKWVFNVADSAVVVGCILAVVFVIFDKKAATIGEKTQETDVESRDE
ncbi:MAG: signal peptidase II [Clostridia bacterium]|nr:signal peptidase II [Clostridia bacterium]